MSTAIMLAWSGPKSQETVEQFNSWYEATHVQQISAAIGSVKVTRYVFETADPVASPSVPRYLAVYEVPDADIPTANAAMLTAFQHGEIELSPSMDPNAARVEWYSRT